jgi:tetratricopeptide (TPR) repeat protein
VANSSGSDLQHPRRSLGNRHRSQAEKFLALVDSTSENVAQNLGWAEQSARQAVLHDFTHEENWRILAKIKEKAGDEEGLRAVLEDLFSVLGRDPELLSQLADVDMLQHGFQLLSASLAADPLDPDYWIQLVNDDFLIELKVRFFQLDLSDPRANILFGRRLERIRTIDEELFILLVRRLLAHRPFNHEAWIELGLLHESRKEFDEAWYCYDQAQTHFPQLTPRDKFRTRMENRLDGTTSSWSAPSADGRSKFLKRMENLALKVSSPEIIDDEPLDDEPQVSDLEANLLALIENQEYSSAFFLARRLVTNGEAWAEVYLKQAQDNLTDSTS